MNAYIDDEITHSSKKSVYMGFIQIPMPFHLNYNSMVASDNIYLKNHNSYVSTVIF